MNWALTHFVEVDDSDAVEPVHIPVETVVDGWRHMENVVFTSVCLCCTDERFDDVGTT